MFKKLRKNFILLNMITISTMMVIAFSIIYIFTYQNTTKNLQDKLSNLPTIAPMFPGDTSDEDVFIGGILPSDYSLSFNMVFNNQGQLIKINSYVDMPMETYVEAANTVLRNNTEFGTTKLESRKWMYQIRPNSSFEINNSTSLITGNSHNVVFLDITDTMNNLNNLLFTFILVGIIMLGVIYLISLYFAKKSVEGIESAWIQQKQFVADASHEFKTPIAVINANANALLLENQNQDSKWIDYIKNETVRMNHLVSDLLYLAAMEDMDNHFESMPVNISNLINKIILSMEAIIYEKDINLEPSIESDIFLQSDASKLEQVMIILIDNAVKYTPAQGNIFISLKRVHKSIEFSVENSGEGIEAEDLDKLFDRFYRKDAARTGIDNSYGLGLPISKVIVERMGGKIKVESTPGKTTKFSIILKSK